VAYPETDRVRAIWDRSAPHYDRAIAVFERLLFGGGRQWVCAQAHGDVLEIAVGTGRNLPYYPKNIRLTGIELSAPMLQRARRRAADLGIASDLRQGDAQTLAFGDESFDTVVCTLALCSIPDDSRAVAEAFRVLRPGGRLILLEHVRSPIAPIRFIESMLDPLAVRFEGDHLVREPLEDLREAGFEVERLERHKLGIVERVSALKPALK
jgi:ubiquinone/menaquinone biosynthesis C-methylase UbiE